MEMIQLDYDDDVAVMRLARSATNALNLQFVFELSENLKKVQEDPRVRGIVLGSSSEKFFSIGYDIPELYGLSRKDFATFYRAFNQVCFSLYRLPKPTVAALTGHATAGGCALALCCDYRFIAEGRKRMGINVLRLGLPAPLLVDYVLQQVVGSRIARDIIHTGAFYLPDELVEMGMVDGVFPSEEVLPRSVEKAHHLGALSPEAFAATKGHRVQITEAQISARLAEDELSFVECWFSEEARGLLKEAMEKFSE